YPCAAPRRHTLTAQSQGRLQAPHFTPFFAWSASKRRLARVGLIKGAIGAAAKANGAHRPHPVADLASTGNSPLELPKTTGSTHRHKHSSELAFPQRQTVRPRHD